MRAVLDDLELGGVGLVSVVASGVGFSVTVVQRSSPGKETPCEGMDSDGLLVVVRFGSSGVRDFSLEPFYRLGRL